MVALIGIDHRNIHGNRRFIHDSIIRTIFQIICNIFLKSITNVFRTPRSSPVNKLKPILLALLVLLTIPAALGDLQINTHTPSEVDICNSTRYVVYINNTGSPVGHIAVNVSIPQSFAYDPGTAKFSISSSPTYAPTVIIGQHLNWTNSSWTLGNNKYLKIVFNLTAGCGAPTGQRLITNVTCNNSGPYSTPSLSMLVNQGLLKITKEPTVIEAGKGDIVTWTIKIRNEGTGPAFNVRVNDTYQAGLELINITSPGNLTQWSYDKIDPLATKQVNATFRVIGCSDLINLANVSWGCGNNICQETYAKGSIKFVPQEPNLVYTITPNPIVVPYCNNTSVTVTLTNKGANVGNLYALNLNFTDMPTQYAISNVTGGVTWDKTNHTFIVGDIAAGGTKEFKFDFGMPHGGCDAKGLSGTINIYPDYLDECSEDWFPEVSQLDYSMDPSSIPSVSVSKNGTGILDLLETGKYNLSVHYTRGGCAIHKITANTLVDTYPPNFEVVDNGAGAVDNITHTITWINQDINDTKDWSRTILLKPSRNFSVCSCGDVFDNQFNFTGGQDCCGCNLVAGTSIPIIVRCFNPSVLSYSNKTANPTLQENCRAITYNTTYVFNNSTPLSWANVSFIEPGTNGQIFPDGILTGYANFTVNKACTNKTNITLNSAKNLGFLENHCGKLKKGDVLTINYTLREPNTGSFLDWSQLCVDGYNSSCGQVHCFQEPVQVSVARADYSIDITGVPRRLSSCIAFNLTIDLAKNSPNDDPKWIGHDMNLTYNDSNYRYIGPATIKGINNYPSGSPNPNPTITGHNVTWFLGKNVSRGGNITFKVQKRCPLDQNAFAALNYTDNCGFRLIRTASALPSLMTFSKLEILKTPELIYALNKNLSWNIQVVNTGSGTAYNVSLFDKLDTGLKYNDSKIGSCLSCPFVNDPSNTTLLSPNRVIWKLGNLTPKQEVWVKLNATIIGCNNLNNWAYARQGCGGMECQNISAHSRVELVNAQILAAKHDVGLVDDCGSNTTFFIQIRNGGSVPAYNVTVNDTLPAGLKLNGMPVVTGLTPTSEDYSGNPLIWRFDQPQGWLPGPDIIITFNATVKGNCLFQGGDSFVTINYREPCGRSGPEVDSAVPVQKAQPLLTISKTPSTVYANNGDIVHWTIALNNVGNYEAKNVTLYDILPTNTAFSSCKPPKTGGTGISGNPLVWKLPDISKGSGATILVNATVTACGVPGNNNATVSYRCCPTSATSKSVLITQPSVVTPNLDFHGGLDTCGGNITLVIRNDGATASIKNITEVMPTGFIYKKLSAVITSSNATHGATITKYEPIDHSSINRTLIWNSTNIDRIYHGEIISIKFQLINCVNCCSSVTTSNNILKVNVTDSCGDPFFASRSDSVTPRKAPLTVRKEPSIQHLGNVKWTLYIDNNGNEAASNVSITDVLGDGFTNIVVQPNDGTQFHNKPYPNFTTINWTHQTIPQGTGTWQRVITARANDTCGLNHTNNVTVRGTCPSGCVYSNTSTIAYAWSSAVYELDSMETMLRGQTDLISSFEALLKSTPLDANSSVKFLNSYDDLSSRQQLELNSFENIIRCNWYDLNQSQRIKLSSSFEDLLRRQSNILSSNDDLLKMGFCKLSADNKTRFLSTFESRIEYEQTLLTSFTNLINRQGNLKTSEVQVWNSFLASLEDLIRRQAMILASFQELNKFSCDGSHLTIFKEANTTSVISGGHVRYNITVTNTGDKNITNITINDYILGVIQGPPGITLKPGKNKTYSNITSLTCKNCSNCQCVVCNFATACGNVTGNPIIPICTVSNDVCVSVSQLGAGPVYPGGAMNKRQTPAILTQDYANSAGKIGDPTRIAGDNQGTKCSICGHKSAH